jgi:hypothetical protein
MTAAEELGLCGRCLVVLDVRTGIVARWKSAGLDHTEPAPNVTNPRALASWAEAKIYGDGAVIETDDWSGTFRPVATWQGDPVCAGHLVECRQRELRGGK